ncbi:DUF4219 domain-containing protein/UBN2 domain-containing protein [Senna tora]|uniref:DUF4219 domain-containing protein/UBN2 domain-containing protein n=1 Tax=Senna tora TaxID=362788 RepID=A0A834WPX5_9FABA|nr:DUF4219 domain-containing protein/UBN2 domain-containing protein [Senna tora]
MTTTKHHPFNEGPSITKPPFFDGTNYTFWKLKMKVFIQSQNVDVWRAISQGPHVVTRPESEWNESDSKKVQLNSQAIHYLFCAVNSLAMFISKIINGIAKEMWEKLQGMYEETEEARELGLFKLSQDYDTFRMEEGEGIEDMSGRFENIVCDLDFLGKCYSDEDLVRKVLRSLGSEWEGKVGAMRASGKKKAYRLWSITFCDPDRNLLAFGIARFEAAG